MIFDTIAHARDYLGIHPRLDCALKRLAQEDLSALPLGRIAWEDGVYAVVSTYETRTDASEFEAHRSYADIQVLLSGAETMEVAPLDSLQEVRPYDTATDAAFYRGRGNRFVLTPGSFALLLPQDGHTPCLAVGMPQSVRKLVIKVPL